MGAVGQEGGTSSGGPGGAAVRLSCLQNSSSVFRHGSHSRCLPLPLREGFGACRCGAALVGPHRDTLALWKVVEPAPSSPGSPRSVLSRSAVLGVLTGSCPQGAPASSQWGSARLLCPEHCSACPRSWAAVRGQAGPVCMAMATHLSPGQGLAPLNTHVQVSMGMHISTAETLPTL